LTQYNLPEKKGAYSNLFIFQKQMYFVFISEYFQVP